ncbi:MULTISPECIES: IS66-like element accessory protein TnpA [Acetobacteraceae]|uniref:Transposase n=2 Tax=Acetobacter TaxID=434 RepID=A0A3S3F6N7_9PROT|nr:MULTISPECIES: transposase [Acetobacter]KXV61682.1 transposase [Acetobacter tropicalis]MCP1203925.1 transposase [Acetobacter oryzoeni]MPQ74551.1 transposase [Acetobacter senegalensis]QEE86737.1 transposase [Acetobacter oryzoeni]QEE86785.1 transposase [Acetobacter oryzoeni]
MTKRSEQRDACVAATFAATASCAPQPVIEIVGERRRAYDDTFRRRVVLASYEAGQSVRAIARQFGVHVSVVYRWRQKLGFVTPSAKEQLSFVPVHVTSPVEGLGGNPSCRSGHEASILFPGGEKLMVDSRIAIEDLRKLLQVLRS